MAHCPNVRLVKRSYCLPQFSQCHCHQARSRLRNRDRKPSRFDSRSFRFRFVPIRFEISISRFIIDYFNFDFGILICMFSDKSIVFRYYLNVTVFYQENSRGHINDRFVHDFIFIYRFDTGSLSYLGLTDVEPIIYRKQVDKFIIIAYKPILISVCKRFICRIRQV